MPIIILHRHERTMRQISYRKSYNVNYPMTYPFVVFLRTIFCVVFACNCS